MDARMTDKIVKEHPYEQFPQTAQMPVPTHLRKPWFTKLCGCSLKTASLIYGYLIFIFQFIGVIILSILVAAAPMSSEEFLQQVAEEENVTMKPGEVELLNELLYDYLVASLVACCIMLFSTILLLIGIYKENAKVVFTYLVMQIILTSFIVLEVLHKLTSGQVDAKIVSHIVTALFTIAGLIIVSNYHKELKIKLYSRAVAEANCPPPPYSAN